MRYLSILFLLLCIETTAQKFVSETSLIGFYSHATIEDIKADNKKAVGLFNTETTDIVFSVPMSEFQFAKSLMQEHFNEKYMESDKYPKATFQGKVTGFDAKITSSQQAKAIGKMTIHGITNDIEISGTIDRKGDKLVMKSKFIIKLEDYKITIPQLLWQNIAEQVEVTIDFLFKPQ